ncbi:DUF1003 domain-containing protein [Flaviaesturariibacter flavus]|uniref:DUF1003 domain-containing protein n=1 Tax=Flaviaesturariibacter flavus TaxID=2502780 RepID=UPI001A9D6650|nr:DUF1003 domain-containing protein [Flaviaesturariibacter flavus]
MNSQLTDLLDSENQHLKKLNEIVVEAIEEERILSHKLSPFDGRRPTFRERLEDNVSSFGGSWTFIFLCLLLMFSWMALNTFVLRHAFDPYPYILLNLGLSTVAALQAPIIMMSQNRKEEKDRQRAANDYMVNLKAEIEVRNLHQKLDLLISEQMKTLFDIQKVQVEIMEEIRAHVLRRGNQSSKGS